MTTTLQIDTDVYKALEESFGVSTLHEKLNDILLSAIESKLEKFNREISHLEKKYGSNFGEFAKKWQNNEINAPHSYEVESDYIDWEIYEMEKKDLIAALNRMKKAIKK